LRSSLKKISFYQDEMKSLIKILMQKIKTEEDKGSLKIDPRKL